MFNKKREKRKEQKKEGTANSWGPGSYILLPGKAGKSWQGFLVRPEAAYALKLFFPPAGESGWARVRRPLLGVWRSLPQLPHWPQKEPADLFTEA